MRFTDWAMKVQRSLTQLLKPNMTAQVHRHAKEEPEAMGKEVWLAGTDKMVRWPIIPYNDAASKMGSNPKRNQTGAIKKAYDNPSRKLPFSAGFAHDLSLIYGPNLPKISASPGVNVLGEWARYEPVFAASLNVQYLRWGTLNCQIASRAVHTAVVEGCDYVWTRYLAQKTPLFFGEPGRIPNLPRGGPEACYALEDRLTLKPD